MLAFSAVRRSVGRLCTLAAAAAIALGAVAGPATAQIGSDRYSSIVIDSASGTILSAANPDDLRFPASLTKMMTLYLLFEGIRDHRVGLNQYVPVSESAASMSPTKLGLTPGSAITVEQCIFGLVTKSANDAAAALGELLGGDEDRFAQMMTARAHALGMSRTTFRNASGLPDWGQVTTARDMAILARHLVQDFPEDYHYFSTPYFMYGGHMVRNHQSLLTTYAGADGLKTGYTDASGYNVVTSALRGDTRLIGVVLGAGNSGERNAHMTALLDQGFDRMGVPPFAMARRDPAPRLPSFISLAHAAPAPAQPAPALPAPILTVPIPPRAVAPRGVPELPTMHRASDRYRDPRLERPLTEPAYAAHSPRPATVQARPTFTRPTFARPTFPRAAFPRPAYSRTAHSTPSSRYPG